MYDDGMDNDSVAAQLDELQREIEGLELENSVFEAYLKRNDQEDGNRIAGGGRSGGKWQGGELSTAQKCDVASEELEVKKKAMDDAKQGSEKLIDTLKAVLEETETRVSELKKEAYEFKRDIVVGGENMRTGRTAAEKVLKYMEEKLKQRDLAIDKLKLKNGTLKSKVSRLEGELKAKDETGDVLHYIDFHQLQIENKQLNTKIGTLNNELFKLKVSTGSAVAHSNEQKEKLNEFIASEAQSKKDIEVRKGLLAKLGVDLTKAAKGLKQERRTAKRLAQDNAGGGGGSGSGGDGNMPQALDYVAQKAEMFDLQQVLATWERKVQIMEMAAKRARAVQRSSGMR